MDGVHLQQRARDRAEQLPGADLEHPFGPDWDDFKVRGKVFLLLTAVTGSPVVVLKADPADARVLREQHDDVTPGYHMDKRHWITLHPAAP
ncbi:MmcQ/YjbR family DNA-binding protein [Aeromicrobium massiliense]|uniref:MmcQ/YjbR family DNA-binding protein n=1 Tax=Aeromicrobium massiliense TaxID=1464554 RepID=UPI0002EFA740|nr:MmcQ/YjbR family DNA-binding protein [Aeromicrobium massiliense]